MPFAEPYIPPRALPAPTIDIERAILDLKAVDNATAFHKAKDVAAFANHLGGTIIIGATEDDGHLDAYRGTDPATAARIRTAFDDAVRARCSPLPRHSCEEYPDPNDGTRVIVLVNVEPTMSLVGVKLDALNDTDGYRGEAYVYPVRTGTQTIYLKQDQVPMFMTPSARRAAVMLSRIQVGTSVNILEARNGTLEHMHTGPFYELRELDNVVSFRNEAGDPVHIYPLDCIVSVYESWDTNHRRSSWRMIVQFSR